MLITVVDRQVTWQALGDHDPDSPDHGGVPFAAMGIRGDLVAGRPLTANPIQPGETDQGIGGSGLVGRWLPPIPTDGALLVRCRTDLARPRLEDLGQVLSAEERQRAARFVQEADQRRAIIGRALLRCLLGHWLDLDPAALVFTAGWHGKPELPGSPVRFNLSHSGDWILAGFARHSQIGVDVERLARANDLLAIAERFFHPAEQAVIRAAADQAAQRRAFFRFWTAKEAILKIHGAGISGVLTDLCICEASNHILLPPERTFGLPAQVHLACCQLDEGYPAAVALEHPVGRLVGLDWSDLR